MQYENMDIDIRSLLRAVCGDVDGIEGSNASTLGAVTARAGTVEATMLKWQVVMRVTAVEVYLQEALAHYALYDPEFLRARNVKQEWTFEDLFDHSETDSVLWAFCLRWSHGFVGKGSPQSWGTKLQKMGVPEFADGDLQTLDALWGFRHCVVHHGGKVSREFLLRHPKEAESIERDGLSAKDIVAFSASSNRFVMAIDDFIVGTFKRKLGTGRIEALQKLQMEDILDEVAAAVRELQGK
jgi:hypothetical protein